MYVCPECGETSQLAGACPRDGTALADRKDDLLLGTSIGSWRVARLLGVGGMGRVYKGVQPNIGSRVAIKVLAKDCADDRDLVERFFAEARTVNLIRHESIVNVLDLATLPDGRPFIVMEYLDGAPLSNVIERRGPLPMGGLARAMGEVLDALGAAHAKEIVHRDLKPDNIYITPSGRAKVLDFGIAKLIPELSGRSGPTRTGSLLGTPHYMSPEQALADKVDQRTDLYAMGVILFEGVTGKKPFEGDALFKLLRQHIEAPPPRPSALRADLPPAFEALILKALEKDPAKRHQTAAELAGALAEATQVLPAEQWAPIGTGSGVLGAIIGPPSGAGLAGSRPGAAGGGAAAVAAKTNPKDGFATTVSSASAELSAVPASAPTVGGRGAVGFLAVAAVLALCLGGGITFAVIRANGAGDDETGRLEDALAAARDRAKRAGAKATHDDEATAPAAAGDGPGGGTRRDRGAGKGDADDADGADEKAVRPSGDKAATDARDDKPSATRDDKAGAARGDKAAARGDKTAARDDKRRAEAEETPPTAAPSGARAAADDGPRAPPPPPPKRSAGGKFDPKHFDVGGYIATALAGVRADWPDAVFVRLDANGVYPDGYADLTLGSGFDVTYRFMSPSRGERPKDLPLGVDFKSTCMYYVTASTGGIEYRPIVGFGCKGYELTTVPRCSPKEIWDKAIARGAPATGAVAELGYWATKGGKGRWHLSVADVWSNWVEDACK